MGLTGEAPVLGDTLQGYLARTKKAATKVKQQGPSFGFCY